MRAIGASALVIVASCVAALPSRAHAYLDGARFDAPAIEGGAGGRSFTGAPADGYTCSVCHRGGGTAPIAIAGIPPDGWAPGVTYELTLTMPEGTRTAGAALEIAGDDGADAGALALVPDAELDASDRCRDGASATSQVLAGERLIARIAVCGAARARVRWTAPAMPQSGVRLFASAVAGNDSADASGDGVTAIVLPLRTRAAPESEGAILTQRCSATAGRNGRAGVGTALALTFAAVLARRRRARSRARSLGESRLVRSALRRART